MSNHGAQELYRTFGFVPAGIRKNYYSEVNEDGLVMWAHGVDTDDYTIRLERIGARLAARGRRTRSDRPRRRGERCGARHRDLL